MNLFLERVTHDEPEVSALLSCTAPVSLAARFSPVSKPTVR